MTKKITLQQLLEKEACSKQVSMFKELFGKEVEVTLEGAIKVAQIFYWDWAVLKILNKEQFHFYLNAIQPAQETYKAVVQSAWETYKAVVQSAWEAVVQSAREAYQAVVQSAQEAYQAVVQSAQEAYNRAKASAFAKAYSLD